MSYTEALEQNNAMLRTMQTTMDKLANTLDNFANSQKTFTEQTKKAKKAEKELNKELVTREETLAKAFGILKEGGLKVKKFEILSKKSFKAFKEAGGNAFDYFDLALSSANQRVKIFGVEAALARKVMYGFLPPGMFRLVNQLSTSFRFLGGLFRKTAEDGEDIDNVFKKMIRGMLSIRKLPKMNLDDFKNMREERKKILKKSRRMSGGIRGQGITIRSLENRIKATEAGGMDASYLKTRLKKEKELLEKMNISRTKYLEKSKLGRRILLMSNVFKVINPKNVALFFGKALKFFLVTMLYFTLFLTVLYILYNTVGKSLMNAFEETKPLIEKVAKTFMGSLGLIWSGIQDIWSAFFGGGNLENIIDGVFKIGVGILGAALTVIGGLLAILGALIWNTITDMATRAYNYFTGEFLTFKGYLKSVPMMLAIIAGIAAFIYGAPIWLAGVAFLVVYRAGAWFIGKLRKSLGLFANGGVVNTPMQVVGERGPELVKLPQGSRVYSNSTSKKMVGGKSVVNNFNITVNAKDSSKAEMRRMADEIGRMINSKINRSTSSSTFR